MPFFPATNENTKGQDLIVVVDNSFSMQAKGKNGELLKKSLVDLIKSLPESEMFTLLTNDNVVENITVGGYRNEIQNIDYTSVPWNLETVVNRIQNLKKDQPNILLLTDGVQWEGYKMMEKLNPTWYIQEKEMSNNVSIDSVFIENSTDLFYNLGVVIKKYGNTEQNIAVRILSDQKSIANQTFTAKDSTEKLSFSIPKTTLQAEIAIEDGSLLYDNYWYFSIPTPKKQQVLSIGDADKENYLSRIFSNELFNYQKFTTKNLDYSLIEKQDAIILNEVVNISTALQNTLKNFVAKGGQLIIVPNENQDLQTFNNWLQSMGAPPLEKDKNEEKKITTIHFNHPVYKGVFEKKVTNFQYPFTTSYFKLEKQNSKILSYEDGSSFLNASKYKDGVVYMFANPIDKKVSNFQNSPLIVPTFFNLGQRLDQKLKLSFTIGQSETMIVNQTLQNDRIIEVKSKETSFIPLQQAYGQQTKLTFFENPTKAGNYELQSNGINFKLLSFNYQRNESNFSVDKSQFPSEINITKDLSTFFTQLENDRNPNYFWKWLVFLGFLFLVIELLIQKFVR